MDPLTVFVVVIVIVFMIFLLSINAKVDKLERRIDRDKMRSERSFKNLAQVFHLTVVRNPFSGASEFIPSQDEFERGVSAGEFDKQTSDIVDYISRLQNALGLTMVITDGKLMGFNKVVHKRKPKKLSKKKK